MSTVKTPSGEITIRSDVVLSAAGITANIENIGLEDVGIATDRGKILVDKSTNQRTRLFRHW